MKKTRICQSQIVSAIKQHESGKFTSDIWRKPGVHQAIFYNWKKKYCGMDSQELRRMKELEEENQRLKQMYAELALDHKILKDVPKLQHTKLKILKKKPNPIKIGILHYTSF